MDIKAIRSLVGQTQHDYADNRGIPVGTLRNWEQEKARPPEYLVRLLEAEAMNSMAINWGSIKLMKTLDELAEKTEGGFVDFADATDEQLGNLVVVDRNAEDADGAPIALDCVVDEIHHDVVSHYGDDLVDVIIRVVDDENPFIIVKSLFTNDQICIENGTWYFA